MHSIGVYLSLLFLFTASILSSQEQTNTQSYFSDIQQESVSSIFESINFKPNLVENYEFRTESKDSSLSIRDYTFRMSFTNRSSIRAQNQYLNLLKSTYIPKNLQEETIQLRYESWIKLANLVKLKDAKLDQMAILKDMETVVRKQSQSANFDYRDLMEIENKHHRTQYNIDQIENKISEWSDDPLDLSSFKDLVTIEDINYFTSTLILDQTLKIDPEYQSKSDLIDSEIAIEKAESRQVLDFAQLKVRSDDDLFDSKVYFGLGLQIPSSNGRRLKMAELEIKKAILEQEFQADADEQQFRTNQLSEKILAEIKELETFETYYQKETDRYKVYAKKSMLVEGFNPLTALKAKELEIQLTIEKLEIENNIYEIYLELLEESGYMYLIPFQNYLLRD